MSCDYPYCGREGRECIGLKTQPPEFFFGGENPPMPLSSKEKQEAFRARNAMLGLTEVRGIFLPPELHAELKKLAKELLARHPV